MGQAKLKRERKEAAPQRGRVVLTGIMVAAEITTYNARGQIAARPKPIEFGVLEAAIPPQVAAFLLRCAIATVSKQAAQPTSRQGAA